MSNPLIPHSHISLPLLPLELQILILGQIPPAQIFTLQRVSHAWHAMLSNPSLQNAINDQIPFLTTATSLSSRLKRRMRMLKSKPVWIKSFHEVFPDFDREPGGPVGWEGQQWVRYAGNGYLVAIIWGDLPSYSRMDGNKHTCAAPRKGSEFEPNPVFAKKRMLKIGHVKSAHAGKGLIELDLFEVIKNNLPGVYKEWVMGQAYMDEPVLVSPLVTQNPMDRQIIPYHLHVDNGLVVVGLRTQKPWPLRRWRNRNGDEDLPGVARSYDGVRCCGDYYLIFSLHDGSLLQHMYVPPMFGDGSFRGDDHLVLSQVNSSTLFLLYSIRVVDPPDQIVKNGYKTTGEQPNWITKHLRLLSFDMSTGKNVGPDQLLLQDLGNGGHRLKFPHNSDQPRCLLGAKGEIYFPIKGRTSSENNTANLENNHVLVALNDTEERIWAITKLPRAYLAGEEFVVINPRHLDSSSSTTSSSSNSRTSWQGIVKDLLAAIGSRDSLAKQPAGTSTALYEGSANPNQYGPPQNKITDLEMFHVGDSPHQNFPTSTNFRSRKVLAHIGSTACSVLYPPYDSTWQPVPALGLSSDSTTLGHSEPTLILNFKVPDETEPSEIESKSITFYKWQTHSPNSTLRKYTLTVPLSLPIAYLGRRDDPWICGHSGLLRHRYYCQCGASQCITRQDSFIWGYHVTRGWDTVGTGHEDQPTKYFMHVLPYPGELEDVDDQNTNEDNLVKNNNEGGWRQAGHGIVGDKLTEMMKLIDSNVQSRQLRHVGFSFLWGDDGLMAWIIQTREMSRGGPLSRRHRAIVVVCWDEEWAF